MMHTQKQKSGDLNRPEPRRSEAAGDMFMQANEMTSWLHYPDDYNSFETINNLFYPPPPVTGAPTDPPPSVILPSSSTVVASNATPAPESGGIDASAAREMEAREMSVSLTSSLETSGSEESDCMELLSQKPPVTTDDRKRKPRVKDTDDNEIDSEDFDSDVKKQSHGGSRTSGKSRSAEVHNLSERRRRDRINEKMKALQELIPRCNKSDKASMLDEAIEYLKSLQMQVQMMSMGCNMVPMMYLGVQPYMPPMVPMGMNRPVFPYPTVLPGSAPPNPAVAAHTSQRFPVPGFNMTPVTVAGATASQAANLTAPMMNSLNLNSQNQPRVLNFADPFQQSPPDTITASSESWWPPPSSN